MKIGIVGVSGVGKTSLMNNLEKRIRNVKIVPEATKGDICKFSNLPLIDHAQATKFQLAKYDIGRVEYQLKLESEMTYEDNKHLIFDKALPVALMYALTLSSRLIPASTINEFVQEVKLHTKRHYDLLVYIPHNPKFKVPKDLNRNFINSYLLQLQDAALIRVLDWLDCPIVTVSATNFDLREIEIISYLGVTA